MSKVKYRPPSPRIMGVRPYINQYWREQSEKASNGKVSYGFKDFEWWLSQGVSAADISRAFGFKSAQPATVMIPLFRERGPDAPRE